jgi:hypothetical protein
MELVHDSHRWYFQCYPWIVIVNGSENANDASLALSLYYFVDPCNILEPDHVFQGAFMYYFLEGLKAHLLAVDRAQFDSFLSDIGKTELAGFVLIAGWLLVFLFVLGLVLRNVDMLNLVFDGIFL